MLTFLSGTYFPSKKKFIYEKICGKLALGEKVYLIVPEQASFERDRDFLFTYGERLGNMLTVTSFTHLAGDVLEDNGFRVKPPADETARSVFMSLAVEECADELDIYRRHGARPQLVQLLLGEYAEIRQAGLEVSQLSRVSSRLPDGILKNKTAELSKIFSVYEALVTERFSEASDNIAVMTDFLSENKVFDGATVFFDDFRGFTGAQIKLIGEIISQTKESYVSVYAPDSVNAFDSSAFNHAVRNCRKIRAAASLKGVKCTELKINASHPVPQLDALRASLFCSEKEVCENGGNAVTVIKAEDRYGECDAVAIRIRELLEKGYRCREISVSERSGRYVKALAASLRKYGIPVFEDKRVSLSESPLIKMLFSAVSTAVFGFSTEEIFSYIKTGLAGVSTEECALLENYVYIWQIDRNLWLKPFNGHPDGYGETENEASAARLEKINAVRERVTVPLITLRRKLADNDGGHSCRAVFEFLTEINASRNFLHYAEGLFGDGNEAAAIECAAVWDTLTQSLDALYEILSERNISARRFYELFRIILSSGDIGRIPAGIDEIVIGTVGRTRHLEPSVSFILGCCDGNFPEIPLKSGLFTSSERRILCTNEFNLENIPENIYSEERMIAYSALTNASDMLFLSYPATDSSGAKAEPSEIIKEVEAIIPDVIHEDASELSVIDKIGSAETAFEQCAAGFGENDPVSVSLRKYIEKTADGKKLEALKKAVDKTPVSIKDPETATELFGENMYMSPSKAEVYYSCAFKYFCQYGMNMKKLRVADLDARINGLLIHHLLENVLKNMTNKELCALSEKEMRELIDRITEQFIAEFMGGREDKSVLLNRSLDKTKETAFIILSRMALEFSVCSFETVDVELSIGGEDGIPSYELTLPDGGKIYLGGKVDRVDIMRDEEKSYLRIVDYKTGGKDFKLSDVFDGLNMQMIIYLMCIWENGEERYGNILPAGILYVPANASGKSLGRRDTPEEVAEQRLRNGRMNGMLLDDLKVLEGMEKGCEGRFINAKADKDGVIKGTLLSLEGFRRLHGKIDEMLTEMGLKLHKGEIAAFPIFENEDKAPCIYCDFKDICRRSSGEAHRTPLGMSHEKAVAMLKEGEENG